MEIQFERQSPSRRVGLSSPALQTLNGDLTFNMRESRKSKCPECGGIKDKRAKLCRPCFYKSDAWVNSRWKRTDGYGKGYFFMRGYRYVRVSGHPHADKDGFIREHRWIMEQYLKCILEPGLIVHHLDGNKQNNELDNLAVCTPSEHMTKYHEDCAKWLELGRRGGWKMKEEQKKKLSNIQKRLHRERICQEKS